MCRYMKEQRRGKERKGWGEAKEKVLASLEWMENTILLILC